MFAVNRPDDRGRCRYTCFERAVPGPGHRSARNVRVGVPGPPLEREVGNIVLHRLEVRSDHDILKLFICCDLQPRLWSSKNQPPAVSAPASPVYPERGPHAGWPGCLVRVSVSTVFGGPTGYVSRLGRRGHSRETTDWLWWICDRPFEQRLGTWRHPRGHTSRPFRAGSKPPGAYQERHLIRREHDSSDTSGVIGHQLDRIDPAVS